MASPFPTWIVPTSKVIPNIPPSPSWAAPIIVIAMMMAKTRSLMMTMEMSRTTVTIWIVLRWWWWLWLWLLLYMIIALRVMEGINCIVTAVTPVTEKVHCHYSHYCHSHYCYCFLHCWCWYWYCCCCCCKLLVVLLCSKISTLCVLLLLVLFKVLLHAKSLGGLRAPGGRSC